MVLVCCVAVTTADLLLQVQQPVQPSLGKTLIAFVCSYSFQVSSSSFCVVVYVLSNHLSIIYEVLCHDILQRIDECVCVCVYYDCVCVQSAMNSIHS